jgi:hypothetical protein
VTPAKSWCKRTEAHQELAAREARQELAAREARRLEARQVPAHSNLKPAKAFQLEARQVPAKCHTSPVRQVKPTKNRLQIQAANLKQTRLPATCQLTRDARQELVQVN